MRMWLRDSISLIGVGIFIFKDRLDLDLISNGSASLKHPKLKSLQK